MSETISRDELDRRERMIAAELLQRADEQAEKRIVTAVESVVTNVSLHVAMSEKMTAQKIDSLSKATRLWIGMALIGGQGVAALMAALVTKQAPLAPTVQAIQGFLPFV